jgi:CHAT domain-containing protein
MASQNRQRPNFKQLFAVQNPTQDLSYADLEIEVICRYFHTSYHVLAKAQATKANVIDTTTYLDSVHCVHFSCHGIFDLASPLDQSGLVLADQLLSLGEIFGIDLRQCRLVVLSACETGIIDHTSTSDEYIGLPSGFLYAGCVNVVSSLWTVNQVSTAFLMIKFYQNLMKNQSNVAKALNDAQRWLRDATQQELVEWTEKLNLDKDNMAKVKFSEKLGWYMSDHKPFEHPYHWAAFCAIGQ